MSELDKLCQEKGITIESRLIRKPITKNTDRSTDPDGWKDTAFQYAVTLKKGDKSITKDYWCGSGHIDKQGKPIPPTAADVLSSLLLDGNAAEMTHTEWCDEYGTDPDSRKGLEMYLACQNTGRDVRRLLGDEYETFLNCEH